MAMYRSMVVAFLIGIIFTFVLIVGLSRKTYPSICHLSLPKQSIHIHPSPFEGCGTWQQDYIQRHQAILNGTLPPRYLVSVAVEAGLADRLIGTLTEFYLALFTNRAFQIITYGTLPRFEAAFLSPHIKWSRPTDNDTLIANLKYTYRGQRGYRGDRSYGPNIDTRLYWPIYLVNDEKANAFFLSSNISQYPPDHENVPTLFVASNRGRIVHLFDNPYHRSQLFRMGLRSETAVKCAFQFLFSPTDALRTAMSRELSVLKSTTALKISINIRVGDHVFDPKNDVETILAPYETYFNCALQIESFARLPNQDVIWYVTSDSLRLRQLAKQRYGAKVLTEEHLQYVHGDCGASPSQRYGNCTQTSQDFSIRMAAGQLYAMSMCDYYVILGGSGFGRFGAMLSNYYHNIYQAAAGNRSCTQTDYVTLEVLSNSGAGL